MGGCPRQFCFIRELDRTDFRKFFFFGPPDPPPAPRHPQTPPKHPQHPPRPHRTTQDPIRPLLVGPLFFMNKLPLATFPASSQRVDTGGPANKHPFIFRGTSFWVIPKKGPVTEKGKKSHHVEFTPCCVAFAFGVIETVLCPCLFLWLDSALVSLSFELGLGLETPLEKHTKDTHHP